MLLFMAASSWNDSRVSFCIPFPTRLAGMMKAGTTTRAMRVSRHSRLIITARVTTTSNTFCTTVPRVPVNACWAPDDVVVHAADEGAGLGAGEEGQGHALDVVVERRAQVEDQALADAGRQPPLDHAHGRVGDGQHQGQERQPVDAAQVAAGDGVLVDDLPEDQRREDGDQRRQQDRRQQEAQQQPVGAGERPHPAQDGAVEACGWRPCRGRASGGSGSRSRSRSPPGYGLAATTWSWW